MRLDTVGIAGDWHGNLTWAVSAVNEFDRAGIDTILHLGDFGVGFKNGDAYLRVLNQILIKNKQTIYVTFGNHEDYVRIAGMNVRDDGLIEIASNILGFPRGYRWVWEGRSFVSLGGANSIDKEFRLEGISWWAEEQISMGDAYRTMDGGFAEIMLAHDAPTGVPIPENHRSNWSREALAYAAQSSDTLRAVVDVVRPTMFFHGHYHIYYDKLVTLGDFVANDVYKTRYIGLDRDTESNNIGVLRLADLDFKILPFPVY